MMAYLAVGASQAPEQDGDGGVATAGRAHPTRVKLVLAATRLFQQRGFHGVGLSEILAEAEAPKGSLYHHFPSGKQELAEAAVARVANAVIAALDTAADQGQSMSEFLRRTGMDAGRWLESIEWRDGSLLAVLGQEEAGANGPLGDAVRIAYQRIEMRLAKWLIAEGQPMADARELAETIIAAEEGAMVLARSRRDAAPLHRVSDMLAQLIAAQQR